MWSGADVGCQVQVVHCSVGPLVCSHRFKLTRRQFATTFERVQTAIGSQRQRWHKTICLQSTASGLQVTAKRKTCAKCKVFIAISSHTDLPVCLGLCDLLSLSLLSRRPLQSSSTRLTSASPKRRMPTELNCSELNWTGNSNLD